MIAIGLMVILCGITIRTAIHFISAVQKAAPWDHVTHAPAPVFDTPPAVPATPDLFTSADRHFARDRSLKVQGFYKPHTSAQAGVFSLLELKMGTADEFTAAESHGLDADHEAPFSLVFARMAPDTLTADVANPRLIQVACSRYTLTRDIVSCDGDDAQFGKVAFRGKITPAFITKIAVTGDSVAAYDEGVLTGDLSIGKTALTAVSFDYWANE